MLIIVFTDNSMSQFVVENVDSVYNLCNFCKAKKGKHKILRVYNENTSLLEQIKKYLPDWEIYVDKKKGV